jgi:hypothetical protein
MMIIIIIIIIMCPNVAAEWLAFLPCILQVGGSKLSPKADYPDSAFVVFLSPCSAGMQP